MQYCIIRKSNTQYYSGPSNMEKYAILLFGVIRNITRTLVICSYHSAMRNITRALVICERVICNITQSLGKSFGPPHSCVLILMCHQTATFLSSDCYICVLILLYMCPHTTIYVSSYCNMCPYTTIHVSSYYDVCVLILQYVSS